MPHLTHHRRRHSWPYCGPGAQKEPLPIIKVSAPDDELERQFLTPLAPEDLFDDPDAAASAGIVRPSTRSSSHHHHLWPHFRPAGPHEQYHVSGGGTLRRMIRPPLDKARSLFTVPTTTQAGENVLVSYWVSQEPGAMDLPNVATHHRGRAAHLRERNHRRCHSEQPRSWREPSASLWTLLEE
ncbi:hypothetical protein BDV59DRAFT_169009 [Aspergillus ambiguus]|uniref:uncharacterized protein n=1 Tax=Aspergillus ambiguus TaxID=176160 RepID=UPI003CCCA4C8